MDNCWDDRIEDWRGPRSDRCLWPLWDESQFTFQFPELFFVLFPASLGQLASVRRLYVPGTGDDDCDCDSRCDDHC